MDNNTQPKETSTAAPFTSPQTKFGLPLIAIILFLLLSVTLWYAFLRTPAQPIIPTFSITTQVTEGGIITPSDTATPEGSSVSYTFTPNPGYQVMSVLVDNATTTATSSYNFTNVSNNHSIVVTFAPVYYAVKGNYVYFKDTIAPGVDPKTFAVVSDYYGKDRQGIFYSTGERLTMADANSFTVLDDTEAYAIDSELVFFASSQIFEADAATFKVLGDQYAIDKNYVYSTNQVIIGADPSTFILVGNGYAEDKNNVYYLGQSFTLSQRAPLPIGFGYSANEDSIFYNGFKVEAADRATFIPLSSYYAKDKAHVYYQWEILPEADPITFEIIRGDNSSWSPQVARDSKNVYSEFTALPLNPKVVRILGDHFLVDTTKVYFTNTIVAGADPKTFTAIGANFGVDINGLWSGTTLTSSTSTPVGEKNTTYRYIGDLFATDGKVVYRGSEVLPGANLESFSYILGTYYSFDKQNVYYGSELIAVNSQGLTIFGPGAAFSKTTTEVFHNGIKIEGADPVSFSVSEDGYRATDRSRQYNLQEENAPNSPMDLEIEETLF